jgi:hypothetical protein
MSQKVKVEVDELRKEITVDGRRFPIDNPGCFFALNKIVSANGDFVPTTELRKLPCCKGRLDQILRKYAKEFTRLYIRSKSGWGGGYWFQLTRRESARSSAKQRNGPWKGKKAGGRV